MRRMLTAFRDAWQWMTTRSSDEYDCLRIIVWWETRRIPYNLFLAVTGFAGLMIFFLFIGLSGVLKPEEDAVEPMALVLAPIAANIFYTTGWVFELLLRGVLKAFKTDMPDLARKLMMLGLAFSLLVVLAPGAIWCGIVLLNLANHLMHSGR